MQHPGLRVALALLVSGGLLPATASAQRLRIAFEPRVSVLPDAAVWGRTTTRHVMPGYDSTVNITMTRVAKLSRTPVPMIVGRITVSPPHGRWRLGIDGGIGSGSLRAYVKEQVYHPRTGPLLPPGCCTASTSFRRTRLPLALAQLGVTADRPMRWKGMGVDAGAGVMAQQLRVRTHAMLTGSFGGSFYDRYRYSTVYDPALQGSIALGPVSGRGAGLRLAMRSTHVWRHARLANEFVAGYRNPRTDASGRRWQWQPELTVGWQVPALGRDHATP